MKVTLEGYRKIQQYKELGLSKAKTAEKVSGQGWARLIYLLTLITPQYWGDRVYSSLLKIY